MTGAIALFCFGAVTVLLSLQYPVGSLRMPGSGFLPLALGVMLMALAAAQCAQVRAARPKPVESKAVEPAAPGKAGEGAPARRVLYFMGAVAAATALLGPLGFVPMSFLLMLVLLRVMGECRWAACGLIALASSAASQLVFVIWLKIPLPQGLLGF
jgi:hypothetical protein